MKHLDKENNLQVLFCDNHILVVEKDANLLTQPDNSNNESLEDIAKEWIKKKFNKPGNVFLHPIHRLDKPVSGIVIFARTSKALSRLNEQIRHHKIKKYYILLIEGILKKKKGYLINYLFHDNFKAEIVMKQNPNAKLAKLFYAVIKEEDNKSLVKVRLITGRYHQIRAQFSYLGHPIVGDKKYGSRVFCKKIKLHQYRIKFLHPITKKQLCFQSKPSFCL